MMNEEKITTINSLDVESQIGESETLLDQMKTSCPFSASITARAVPQLPEPMTVTFFISCDLQSYFFKSQFPKRIYFLEPNLFSVPFKSFLIFPLCRQNAIALTKIVK